MIDDRNLDIHAPGCGCDDCPVDEATIERERKNEAARESIARSDAVRRFDRRHFPEQVAEADEFVGLSYRAYLGLSLTSEQQRRHDELLAKRRARHQHNRGES